MGLWAFAIVTSSVDLVLKEQEQYNIKKSFFILGKK